MANAVFFPGPSLLIENRAKSRCPDSKIAARSQYSPAESPVERTAAKDPASRGVDEPTGNGRSKSGKTRALAQTAALGEAPPKLLEAQGKFLKRVQIRAQERRWHLEVEGGLGRTFEAEKLDHQDEPLSACSPAPVV